MDYRDMIRKATSELARRGPVVAGRRDWYEGRHPARINSAAWNKTFAAQVASIKENLIEDVIDARSDAVHPVGFAAVDANDPLAVADAEWLTELIKNRGAVVGEHIRAAEVSGVQTALSADYDRRGDVVPLPIAPESCYGEVDRAGDLLWAVHLWADALGVRNATVYLPELVAWLSSASTQVLPDADTFRLVEETPNPFGEVMLAVVDKRGTLVDKLSPLNAMLNKSLQAQHVQAEKAALKTRAWMGIDTYDPRTGQQLPSVDVNPATGTRDLVLPSSKDEDGNDVKVLELEEMEPGKYISEQESYRAAIMRGGFLTPSVMQTGGSRPVAAEALEIELMPHIARKRSDERYYTPMWQTWARHAVMRRVYALTGLVTDPPAVRVVFEDDSVTTDAARWGRLTEAVAAGLSLEDALVETLGKSREEASQLAGNAAAAADAAASRSAAAFDAGSGFGGFEAA